MDTPVSAAYRAARESVALADLAAWGWGRVRVFGPDRLAFLQRLSTNDFRKLAPCGGLPTVLTSPTGRVLAFLIAYAGAAGDETLYLRTEPGRAQAVARYLGKLIFWNDHVEVADASAETAQWALLGPGAGEALARILDVDEAALPGTPAYGWTSARLAGVTVALHRGGPLEVAAWTVVAGKADAAAIGSVLGGLGPGLDAGIYEQLRVEGGIPAWGKETSDQVTPLESGLVSAIHFNKGCYTGQEVIARMANYEKIPRRLAGLLLPEGAGPELSGAAVVAGSGRPGFVGSVVQSPAVGRMVALAVVPRNAGDGDQVTVKGAEGPVTATVVELPFVK